VLGQGAARVDALRVQRAVRQAAERGTAADVGHLEPRAFLGAHRHHRDVAARHQPEALERRHRHQPRDHAGRAVEVAAVRHAVQVRADHHARRVPVAPRQRHVRVRREVPLHAETKPLRRRGRRRVRALLAGAVGVARHARLVQAVAPQRIEQRDGHRALRRHRFADLGR
jgi:hypothetical protein